MRWICELSSERERQSPGLRTVDPPFAGVFVHWRDPRSLRRLAGVVVLAAIVFAGAVFCGAALPQNPDGERHSDPLNFDPTVRDG